MYLVIPIMKLKMVEKINIKILGGKIINSLDYAVSSKLSSTSPNSSYKWKEKIRKIIFKLSYNKNSLQKLIRLPFYLSI